MPQFEVLQTSFHQGLMYRATLEEILHQRCGLYQRRERVVGLGDRAPFELRGSAQTSVHESHRTLSVVHELSELLSKSASDFFSIDVDVLYNQHALVLPAFQRACFGMKKQFGSIGVCSEQDVDLWIVRAFELSSQGLR